MAGPASIARDQLRAIVERIEKLNEELDAINGDKKEVYAEAKANGYDTKILKKVVQLRKMDSAERQETDALLDLYMHALGMISDYDGDGSVVSGDPYEDHPDGLPRDPRPSRAPAREEKPKADPKKGNAATACYHSDKVIEGGRVICDECRKDLGPADNDLDIPPALRRTHNAPKGKAEASA
jgi:uncharacterized protein (UPF0335 family)